MKAREGRAGRIMTALIAAALIAFGAVGCKTTGDPVNVREGVTGNIAVDVEGTLVTIMYTSVGYPEDAWVIEQAVVKNKATHLVLHLCNPGGSALFMFDICDTLSRLRESGVHITTVARGAIMSAAVPIFLQGDVRLVSPTTWIMMHPGGWKGHERQVPPDFLRVFEEMELAYADIVCSRTTFPMEKMRKILNIGCTEKDKYGNTLDANTNQYWMTTKEALMWGFATGLLEAEKTKLKAMLSLYTCPVHPQERFPGPGECPICRSKLVPVGRNEG